MANESAAPEKRWIGDKQQYGYQSGSPVKKPSTNQIDNYQQQSRHNQGERAALEQSPPEQLEEPGHQEIVNRPERMPVGFYAPTLVAIHWPSEVSAVDDLVGNLQSHRLVAIVRHWSGSQSLGGDENKGTDHDQ